MAATWEAKYNKLTMLLEAVRRALDESQPHVAGALKDLPMWACELAEEEAQQVEERAQQLGA